MKKFAMRYWVKVIFILTFFNGYSQNTNSQKSINRNAFSEKIYLQLSNTIFATGETIWFKAIVTNTLNVPSKLSGILHVELIDYDENIVTTKKLKLENGLAYSFFELSDKLSPGRYLVRAYTTWNSNFGSDFVFKQYIDVFKLNFKRKQDVVSDLVLTEIGANELKITAKIHPETLKRDYKKDLRIYLASEALQDSIEVKPVNGQYAIEYVVPKDLFKIELKVKLEDTKLKNRKRKVESTYSKTIVLNNDFIDLQFFPEGGKMVDGFTNKVAYKSINGEGLGAEVSGYIVDEIDSIVTSFSTNKIGMGFVFFMPDKNKTYYGKIMGADKLAYKYPLPKVMETGYLLRVGETSEFMGLSIKSNIETKDSLYVEVKSRGVLIQKHPFILEHGKHEALVKKTELPNGIVGITLFNSDNLPVCERLFFNFDESSLLNITASTDKEAYTKRDKTVLNLNITNKDGKSVPANFSTLVMDKDKLAANRNYQPDILSYFLLHSELKGFIETPSIYFDKKNIYRKRDLDALMLTQGWRNYVFNNNDTNFSFDIKPEVAMQISGNIRSVFNKNKAPKKRVDLTMLTSGKPPGIYTQTVDSIGNFVFNLRDHYTDELEILIQSANKKGKAKDFDINIDKPLPAPKIFFERAEAVALPDTVISEILKLKTEEKRAAGGFNLSDDTVELDAVQLTGYNVTPEREKLFKLHGAPDTVIENEELIQEEEQWMSGLYDLLRVKFPDDIYFENVRYPSEAFGVKQDPSFTPVDTIVPSLEVPKIAETNVAFVFIDGEIVEGIDYPLLPFLSVENIKSVEILRKPSGAVLHYFQEAFPRNDLFDRPAIPLVGIISIYTYGGVGMSALSSPKGIYKGKILGFSTKREFYVPKYDVLKPEDWDIPDLRPVIHWEPSMTSNKKGEAQLEFYNDDSTGDKLILIEAITQNGKLGYFETSYTVEKRLENN
ncbi:hypothetical protein E1J38_003865 [Seonamhaeicola sediminis]|uniref:Macroglobulin domain-containing protein n=1 Tax=Seonamhaeicola sediminis TaxID=2528206 RepID=A0A562YGG6_9FLAO|nr:hypothetical protein [Seonamhaeicola sediminis]TWO33920.1 hypothetical protein E1J38_003865 [Seonamhaeicola sediminis]